MRTNEKRNERLSAHHQKGDVVLATIKIQMDSDAFHESASAELARILRNLADCVVMADLNDPFDRKMMLRDSNGNLVGQFLIPARGTDAP